MADAPDVHPGQTWADNDPRNAGRTLLVERIEDGRAVCTVLTDSDAQRKLIAQWGGRSMVGKTRLIRLDRMRPTSTGYRLVEDVSEPAKEG